MTGHTISTDESGFLRIAGWEVDRSAHRLTHDRQHRRLEPRVMQLLLRLAAQPGQVVSRTDLLTDVWGDVYVGDDAVSAAVIKLRKAFGDSARSPTVIETVPKSGYRLIGRVEHGPPSPADDADAATDQPAVRRGTVLRCAIDARAIDGSTPGAEAWQRVMEERIEFITRIVESRGGWVVGETSAIVSIFGAPTAQEHHARQAVSAAMKIREAESAELRSTPELEVGVRLGIASGDVVTAVSLDSPASRPIYGEPLQQAAALVDIAQPGEILLTEETLLLSEGLLGVQPHDPPPMLVGTTHVFLLDATGSWSTAWEARMRRGLTSLRGRSYEMAQFERLLDLAVGGEGQLLALSGEPGVGKSRLLHELLARASARGFTINVGSTSPVDRRSPFFAFQSMLSHALKVESRNPEISDLAALSAVLEPGDQDDAWHATDPDLRQSRILAVVLGALLSNEEPVVIAIEDLHWSDQATQTLIGELADRIARRKCLLVLSYRPEFVSPWGAKSYATRVRVDPLDQAAAAAMLDELAGDHPSLDHWKKLVLENASGTPLFVEESVRAAEAIGAVEGTRGGYTMAQGAAVDSIPPSVQGLLAERIDRLSAPARSALSLAAVIGREVPAPLLDAMLDADDIERERVLGELQAAELLYEVGTRQEPSYLFKHALTQDVAYVGIPASIRREHHRRIAELLETELSGLVASTPELLARHLGEAGLEERSLGTWCRAAAAAAESGAFDDALAHLEQARALLGAVPDDSVRLKHELGIELAIGAALIQTVGPTDASVDRAYERARELALLVGTPEQRFEAQWGAWFVNLMRGDIHTERVLGDQVFALAEGLEDGALKLEAHHVQWSGLSLAGQPGEALGYTEFGIAAYQEADHHWLTFSFGGHDPGVCARNLNAMARWLLGDLDTARARSASAIELAAELGHAYTQLEASHAALVIALLEGDANGLEHHALAIKAMVRDDRLPDVAIGYADGFLGAASAIRGDHEVALRLMQAAAPVWEEFWGAWCFPLDAVLGQELAASGNVSAAIGHVENRLALAEETGANWWNSEFLRLLAELRRRDGAAVEEVEALLLNALSVARSQGALFLELRVATSLSSLPAATGSGDAAVDVLRSTIDRFPGGVRATALSDARRTLSDAE